MNSYAFGEVLTQKRIKKVKALNTFSKKKRRTHHLKLITLNKNTSKAKAFKVFEFPLLN